MALITINGTLKDNQGIAVAGSVLFQLTNFGGDQPRVAGTNLVVPITTVATANASGVFTATLQGNDTITPSNTVYQVTVRDKNTTIVTIETYNIIGAGPVDISNLTPVGAVTPIAIGQVVFPITAGQPASTPANGTAFWDGATKRLWIYDGTTWRFVVLT